MIVKLGDRVMRFRGVRKTVDSSSREPLVIGAHASHEGEERIPPGRISDTAQSSDHG